MKNKRLPAQAVTHCAACAAPRGSHRQVGEGRNLVEERRCQVGAGVTKDGLRPQALSRHSEDSEFPSYLFTFVSFYARVRVHDRAWLYALCVSPSPHADRDTL